MGLIACSTVRNPYFHRYWAFNWIIFFWFLSLNKFFLKQFQTYFLLSQKNLLYDEFCESDVVMRNIFESSSLHNAIECINDYSLAIAHIASNILFFQLLVCFRFKMVHSHRFDGYTCVFVNQLTKTLKLIRKWLCTHFNSL